MTVESARPWPRILSALIPAWLLGIGWWWMVSRVMAGRFDVLQAHLSAVVISGLFFFIIFGLAGGFFLATAYGTTVWWRLVIAVVGSWSVVFFFPFSTWSIFAAMAVWIGGWVSLEQAAADGRQLIEIRPVLTMQRTVAPLLWGVMIAISLLYYQQVRGDSHSADQLADRMIGQSISVTERFIPKIYPTYRANQTVDEFIGAQIPTADQIIGKLNFSAGTLSADEVRKQIEAQYGTNVPGLDTIQLPTQVNMDQLRSELDKQFAAIRSDAVAQTREELANRFSVTLTGKETMHQVLQDIISRQFNQSVRRYVQFVPVLLAVAVFFVLRIFTVVFQWAVMLLGWGVIRMLRIFGALRETTTTVEARRLTWN